MPGYTLTATELSLTARRRHLRKGGFTAVMLMGTTTAYSLLSNPYRFDAPGKVPSSIPLAIRRPWVLSCIIAYAENLASNGGYDLPLWGPITSRLRPEVRGNFVVAKTPSSDFRRRVSAVHFDHRTAENAWHGLFPPVKL
jgi:hypothetical protein